MLRNSAVEKVSRFLESMERKEIYFRVDTYINFLKLLVYGNAVDAYSVELPKQFEIGLFPLDSRDFKTEGAKLYFLRWTSLLTIETMEEAKTFKKMAVSSNDITRADAFSESKMARWLNIQAERQMFCPQDGIALSPSHREDKDPLFQPKYFAECVQSRRTGLMILVNLICKVSSDPEELTNGDVPNISHWRVDRFINLVSFRRMLVALKSICARPSTTVVETCPIASVISPEFQDLKLIIDIKADDNAQLTGENAAASVPDAQTSGVPNTSAKREGVPIGGSCKRQEVNFQRPKSENRPGNKSQIEAIDAAMHDGVAIIQGPPGTGKTFTAAEIIRIWLENWDSRPILACAETNEGVNNLIMKVLKLSCVSPDDMVRIGNVSKVTEEMKRITLEEKYFANGHKMHDMQMDYTIVKDIIHRAKIVFSTCIGAGTNYMTEQYFPHVLLDEASQATEPAAMVPLQYGCQRLCLVGDDKQLPPLVKSSNADQLEVSIFER
ncbi:uncharacterized protein LOC117121025 [Anneissia japonica]|uniref:uncharacterized protein LOC117121025 n=1 Tax=Anneissia japonica TaxID=1529436 RepID=UPI001425BA91|nr:uncharacterized protein LOC117121025 [Anneissia japonica]